MNYRMTLSLGAILILLSQGAQTQPIAYKAMAISHAERSKEKAAKEGKDPFVWMNERGIAEWKRNN